MPFTISIPPIDTSNTSSRPFARAVRNALAEYIGYQTITTWDILTLDFYQKPENAPIVRAIEKLDSNPIQEGVQAPFSWSSFAELVDTHPELVNDIKKALTDFLLQHHTSLAPTPLDSEFPYLIAELDNQNVVYLMNNHFATSETTFETTLMRLLYTNTRLNRCGLIERLQRLDDAQLQAIFTFPTCNFETLKFICARTQAYLHSEHTERSGALQRITWLFQRIVQYNPAILTNEPASEDEYPFMHFVAVLLPHLIPALFPLLNEQQQMDLLCRDNSYGHNLLFYAIESKNSRTIEFILQKMEQLLGQEKKNETISRTANSVSIITHLPHLIPNSVGQLNSDQKIILINRVNASHESPLMQIMQLFHTPSFAIDALFDFADSISPDMNQCFQLLNYRMPWVGTTPMRHAVEVYQEAFKNPAACLSLEKLLRQLSKLDNQLLFEILKNRDKIGNNIIIWLGEAFDFRQLNGQQWDNNLLQTLASLIRRLEPEHQLEILKPLTKKDISTSYAEQLYLAMDDLLDQHQLSPMLIADPLAATPAAPSTSRASNVNATMPASSGLSVFSVEQSPSRHDGEEKIEIVYN